MAAPMTKETQKELITLFLFGTIFVAISWFLIFAPGLTRLRSARQQALAARQRTQLVSELYAFELKQKKEGNFFASETELHDFTAKISSLANKNGIDFESLTPTTKPQEHYTNLKINLEAKAPFPTLIKFLEEVENLKPAVAISELSLTAKSGYSRRRGFEGETIPQVEFTLETYLTKK